ncbi:metallophosphoesterase [Pararhizobium sp. YC-54]|uniref:metallophosphoesterase n=1 Tax=Pararhizobium sp. YC-54 TaxID=2986920 RepID=UPI0021F71E02|nr:metallophosphoesterase [Pararhizobium sp. YC-54]MCW0001304.1 metallophosphoesterase [Pararhizobium sp. YC-54]
MIRGIVDFLRGGAQAPSPGQRRKLIFDRAPDHIYAVGDVHGYDDTLGRLEDLIVADSRRHNGTKWLVMLGDYVDRGPKSSAVLTRLTTRPLVGIRRICLAGNHEAVMLDFLGNPSADHHWLKLGGLETLYSYGLHTLPAGREAQKKLLRSLIPVAHVAFLESLPSMLQVPGYCFVHAGLKKGVAPAEQRDADLLWLRPAASDTNAPANGFVTVHGHTPVARVEIGAGRINVDTGIYMSGVLSAVRLSRRDPPEIIQSR